MLSQANTKLRKGFKQAGYKAMSFGLPAAFTCPQAGKCKAGCYALRGAYTWSAAVKKRDNNLRYTKLDDFVFRMNHYLEEAKPKRGKEKLIIRIHDSGDFYNKDYADKWIEIAEQNKDIEFYAYTKSVGLFLDVYCRIPNNLRIIFSFGGKEDHLIQTYKHRHCHIFETDLDLKFAGYADTSNDDTTAALGASRFIGIVYHGPNSKEWSTFKQRKA